MKLKHWLGISLMLLIQTPGLFAQDLDVPRAQARYNQEQAEADRAESVLNREQSTLNSLESQRQSASSRETQAKRNLDTATAELTNIDRRITQNESDITSLQFERDRLVRQRQDLSSDIPTLRRDRDRYEDRRDEIQNEVRSLERRIADLENDPRTGNWTCCYVDRGFEEHSGGHCSTNSSRSTAASEAETECRNYHDCRLSSCEQEEPAELERLRQQLSDRRSELQTAERRLSDAQSDLSNAERELSNIDSRITQNERSISTKQSELSSLRSSRSSAQSRIASAERDLRSAQDDVRTAQVAVDRQSSVVSSARSTYNREESEAQSALAYLQQVTANYNAALSRVLSKADQDATAHSKREADDRSASESTAQGNKDARTSGEAKGAKDGAERDFARGYKTGREQASSNSSLSNSYQSGLNNGSRLADMKAREEDFPRGYNDALRELLGGKPSNTATIDITDSVDQSPGDDGAVLDPKDKTIGSVLGPIFETPVEPAYSLPMPGNPTFTTPSPDYRNRVYPCSGLQLPEFEPKCRERYDQTYVSSFRSGYASSYAAGYRSTFSSQVKGFYDATLAIQYNAELDRGRTTGATQQGTLDGFARDLPAAKVRQYQAGRNDLLDSLSSGHLIVVREASFTQVGEDGLFSSGEQAKLRLVIDNFGKKASPLGAVRLKVASKSNLEKLTFELRELPALEGDTRTILEGVVAGQISSAPAKSLFKVAGQVDLKNQSGTFAALKTVTVEQQIRFPVEIQSITLAKKPKINEEVDANVTFVNNTLKASTDLELSMSTSPSFVSFAGGPYKLPGIEPGQSNSVAIKLKPGVWVADDIPVNFIGALKDADGELSTSQVFPQNISILRNGTLILKDRLGQVVPSGTLEARAGQILQFKVQFKFTGTQREPGPFVVRYTQASDPLIRPANNSTISVNYGSWGPGSTPQPADFAFSIPASLQGKTGWILIQLDDGSSPAQALQIGLNFR